jgi:leucyl aminopeptidase (aminopeptidase T)
MIPDRLLLRAARTLIEDQFDVRPGEGVLITVDTHTARTLGRAIAAAVLARQARPVVAAVAQLPFQGALADPYVPDTLAAAAAASDVWIDCCFPYFAGSSMHDAAMKGGRSRYALLATAATASFARLYGAVDFAALMDFQMGLVEYLDRRAGARVRCSCPLGTEVEFVLDTIKLRRERVARSPGMHTVPGAQSLYPAKGSVRGRVVLGAVFDEHYHRLRRPIGIEVDGAIRTLSSAAGEEGVRFERALRRASGAGSFGSMIHFTMGFHPAARLTGRHFIEDIRALGSNAIGMGLPWWEQGGGENHPDGMVLDQSLWIDDEPVIEAGRVVGPVGLMPLYRNVQPLFE